MLNLTDLIQESMKVSSDRFIEIADAAIKLLSSETGRIGNFTVTDRLVTLDPVGEALVIGDLHGDLKSLNTILQESAFIKKMQKTKKATLIFLGDYGDRGPNSPEVYFVVLSLKLTFPQQVILLRGNHEFPKGLMVSPHDLPLQFKDRFSDDSNKAYLKTKSLFDYLYNAVYVSERYLMVHGGISPEINSLDDIAKASQRHPKEPTLQNLLWSDPDDTIDDTAPSPRCAGLHFGKKVAETVLKKLNAKILIRGHEPCEGFKINHDGKVLTLFSMKGAPYFSEFGTYLQIDLSLKPHNAKELASCIHKF